MHTVFQTSRLLVKPVELTDSDFLLELMNTPEWIKFIGDRHVPTVEAVSAYIRKVESNPLINYLVVRDKESRVPMGIVTFIKRDYLDHWDVGFAFLSRFTGKGFASEATEGLMIESINTGEHIVILASVLKNNSNSIKLLQRLGFGFTREIDINTETLQLYFISADKFLINQLTKRFFGIFTNIGDQLPNWDIIHNICIPETLIIKKEGGDEFVYNLNSFIEPRKRILTDGTLSEFTEYELSEETNISGQLAQRFSRYEKRGASNGKPLKGIGSKMFQFIKTGNGWKISSVIWEDSPV